MKKFAPLLAWPALCLALILAGTNANIPIQQLPWAFPAGWSNAPAFVMQLSALMTIAAVLLGITALIKTRRDRQSSLFLGFTALHLLIFASVWIVLPAAFSDVWVWVLGIVLIAGTVVLLVRSKSAWPAACQRYYFSRRDALADGLILLLPVITGIWAAKGLPVLPGAGPILTSLLLYPLYALFQLSIFLAIPAIRLHQMGYSSRSISIGCAVVFSVVHWPNPLLMAVTGGAMLVWAGQFLRGRSLLVLALVMGVAASGFNYMLPQQWTREMRIGPDYVEKRAELAESEILR